MSDTTKVVEITNEHNGVVISKTSMNVVFHDCHCGKRAYANSEACEFYTLAESHSYDDGDGRYDECNDYVCLLFQEDVFIDRCEQCIKAFGK